MPTDPPNVVPQAEATDSAALLRAVIAQNYEGLLRSVALIVRQKEQGLAWPAVMQRAREVLGAAVYEALAHAEKFDSQHSAAAWVCGIAARQLANLRRSEARARRCVPATDLGEVGWEAALVSRLNADKGIEHRLDLKQALSHLTKADRRVIELRYFRGLVGLELAKELGVKNSGAARVRLTRALKALRKYFNRSKG